MGPDFLSFLPATTGVFRFGIRSSIIRYVSKYTATKDVDEVSGLIITAMLTYSCVGVVSLLLTVVGCIYVDRLFKIPAAFHSTAQLLLLIVGTSVAVGFPLGVFGGMLEGMQKFYVNNWVQICFSGVLRALLIVFYLNRGYGLLDSCADYGRTAGLRIHRSSSCGVAGVAHQVSLEVCQPQLFPPYGQLQRRDIHDHHRRPAAL